MKNPLPPQLSIPQITFSYATHEHLMQNRTIRLSILHDLKGD